MASHTSQPKGGRFHTPPNGKCPRPDLNRHAIQLRILSAVCLPIPPLGHKIQDLSAIRLWSSRVLSEVASHHSCKSDSIKPRMRTIIALQKRLLYCLGDCLRDIHPVLVQGTSQSQEKLIYCTRGVLGSRPSGLRFGVGGTRALQPAPVVVFPHTGDCQGKCNQYSTPFSTLALTRKARTH